MPMKHEDLTGQKFGLVTVIRLDHLNKHGLYIWETQCVCGKSHFTTSQILKHRKERMTCGCIKIRKQTATHGQSKTRFYQVWHAMRRRCYNPKCVGFEWWGGRGIKVCDRWRFSFQNFYDDMFPTYSPGLSIDRINTNGNYEPSNCRWATAKEQSMNTRRNVYLTINGETLCIKDWYKRYKISQTSVQYRVKKGWSLIDALIKPISTTRLRNRADIKEEVTTKNQN